MMSIPIGKYGKWHVLVDDEDIELVSNHKWSRATIRGKNKAYAVSVNKPKISMHRLIMGFPSNMIVDHKNHDGLDNRRSNLRICTKSQNCSNRRPSKNGSSKYLGVSKRGNLYLAQIGKNKKTISLGRFQNEIDAAKAYNEAAKKLHGEFANINEV